MFYKQTTYQYDALCDFLHLSMFMNGDETFCNHLYLSMFMNGDKTFCNHLYLNMFCHPGGVGSPEDIHSEARLLYLYTFYGIHHYSPGMKLWKKIT